MRQRRRYQMETPEPTPKLYKWLWSDGSWRIEDHLPDHNTYLSQYFVSVTEVHDETLSPGSSGVGSDVLRSSRTAVPFARST
jgi:hypothetical protein